MPVTQCPKCGMRIDYVANGRKIKTSIDLIEWRKRCASAAGPSDASNKSANASLPNFLEIAAHADTTQRDELLAKVRDAKKIQVRAE